MLVGRYQSPGFWKLNDYVTLRAESYVRSVRTATVHNTQWPQIWAESRQARLAPIAWHALCEKFMCVVSMLAAGPAQEETPPAQREAGRTPHVLGLGLAFGNCT